MFFILISFLEEVVVAFRRAPSCLDGAFAASVPARASPSRSSPWGRQGRAEPRLDARAGLVADAIEERDEGGARSRSRTRERAGA
jgi:hypothetical protein